MKKSQQFWSVFIALAMAILLQSWGSVSVTHAEEFVVTRTDDPAPDGCQPADADGCSLREAVIAVNNAADEENVIRLAAEEYQLTRPKSAQPNDPTTGDLVLSRTVRIIGQGANQTIINANVGLSNNAQRDRIFHVRQGDFSVDRLTLQNGFSSQETDPVEQGYGGAILYKVDQGVLSVLSSTITNNRAVRGGGVHNEGEEAIINILNSTMVSNSVQVRGGALSIFNLNISDVNIVSSAFIDNTAVDGGGAIYFLSLSDQGEKVVMNIINSTLSGNVASNGQGGGVLNDGNGEVNLQNTTIAFNRSGLGGGGVAAVDTSSFRVANSIIANNNDPFIPDCNFESNTPSVSLGYNLVSDTQNCNWPDDSATDLLDIEPNLATDLSYTLPHLPPYHEFSGSSPAQATVDRQVANTLGGCPFTDQRGQGRSRPCDAGAYQSNSSGLARSLLVIKSGPDLLTRLGGEITYTLNIINDSRFVMNNVVVSDTIPAQASYVRGGNRVENGVVSWDIGPMPPGSLQFRTFVVTTNVPIVNNDFRVLADGFAGSIGFNEVGTSVREPLLSITKEGPTAVSSGYPFQYVLTVRNNGLTATNLIISDTLPAGVTYIPGSGGTLVDGVVRWTAPQLAEGNNGGNRGFTVTFAARANVLEAETIINDQYEVRAEGGYTATALFPVETQVTGIFLPLITK